MDNSNIIVSVIIVLCIAAGVTAYGLTHDTSGIMNSLSGFTPSSSSSSGNGPGDNNTNVSTSSDHNSNGVENTSESSAGNNNGNLSSNGAGNTSGNNSAGTVSGNNKSSGNQGTNGISALVNKNTKTYNNGLIINNTKIPSSNGNNSHIITNNSSSIKNNTSSNDGWISESEAIKLALGNDTANYEFTIKTNNSYIVVFKYYSSTVGQNPAPGWYYDGIEVGKDGEIIGENLNF